MAYLRFVQGGYGLPYYWWPLDLSQKTGGTGASVFAS